MNYLAHSYLSFGDAGILVGNMISDFVKGKRQFDYSPRIQQGIRLHRQIDFFTDQHPATRAASQIFKPAVGAYSGAFIDVVYDHFLANDIDEFSDEKLMQHTTATYQALQNNFEVLPATMQLMLPYMTSQNWLYNYKNAWGTEKSFGGVVRRAKYLTDSAPVFELFTEHRDVLNQYYNDFFPDVKKFAFHQFNEFSR